MFVGLEAERLICLVPAYIPPRLFAANPGRDGPVRGHGKFSGQRDRR